MISCILHSYALPDQVVDDWIELPRDSFESRYMFFSMPTKGEDTWYAVSRFTPDDDSEIVWAYDSVAERHYKHSGIAREYWLSHEENQDRCYENEPQMESQDGEPDDEQGVEENSDGTSTSTTADGVDDTSQEDAQFLESDKEAAQVSEPSDEDEELSNEHASIDSDVNGQSVSSEDAGVVNDDQDENGRIQPMQGDRRGRRAWVRQCKYGNACRALRQGIGCDFHHTAREVYDASRSDGRREDPAQPRRQHEISYDAQSAQFESQDGESDGEQYVDNEGVDRTSDDESASPDAEENEEDEQVSESNEEAAKISNESDEDEQLSNEQNMSIESDGDGSPVSNDDGCWVDGDQDAGEQPSVLPGPCRRRRWTPQCRYGNDCNALRQGTGCDFHHTAREMFEASRADDRRQDSAQWQTRDEHAISGDDPAHGEAIVSYVGVVRSYSIKPNVPENASSTVIGTVHSVYAAQAVLSPNAASKQVANEATPTDGGAAQISKRASLRLSVEDECSPAVDMLEQCAETAGLNETRTNVRKDETNYGSNRHEAFEGASSKMREIRTEMSTEAPMLLCNEHAENTVRDADYLNDENKEATIEAPATETMPDSVNNKGYERWFAVGSATQLNDEANMIRDALAASLLDTGLSEADFELEPIPSPPPASAHAIEDSNVRVGSVQHSVPAQGQDDEGLLVMVLSNTGTHAIQAPQCIVRRSGSRDCSHQQDGGRCANARAAYGGAYRGIDADRATDV